jgi:hypothetical protein
MPEHTIESLTQRIEKLERELALLLQLSANSRFADRIGPGESVEPDLAEEERPAYREVRE